MFVLYRESPRRARTVVDTQPNTIEGEAVVRIHPGTYVFHVFLFSIPSEY